MFLLVALSNGPVVGLNQLSETEEEDQTVTPPVNFSVTQQEVEHHHQTIKLKFQLKCVNQEQKERKRSDEEVSGFRRSHGSRRQLREVSAATSRLAGSSRSPGLCSLEVSGWRSSLKPPIALPSPRPRHPVQLL